MQQWYHLPLIDGPRERLSSPGAIDGRLAPASDGRPANDPRLLAPPIETLAKLLRDDSGRNAILTYASSGCLRIQSCGKGEKLERTKKPFGFSPSCTTTALVHVTPIQLTTNRRVH